MSTDFSPVDLATARERLRALIKELAVVRGKVTLASGIEALRKIADLSAISLSVPVGAVLIFTAR